MEEGIVAQYGRAVLACSVLISHLRTTRHHSNDDTTQSGGAATKRGYPTAAAIW